MNTDHVIICGGREFDDEAQVMQVLDNLHAVSPIKQIIHGGARGADTLAGKWAITRNVPFRVFTADWTKHGKAAGLIRNQQMLDEAKPTLVIGFNGKRGTADMLRRSQEAGVECLKIPPTQTLTKQV